MKQWASWRLTFDICLKIQYTSQQFLIRNRPAQNISLSTNLSRNFSIQTGSHFSAINSIWSFAQIPFTVFDKSWPIFEHAHITASDSRSLTGREWNRKCLFLMISFFSDVPGSSGAKSPHLSCRLPLAACPCGKCLTSTCWGSTTALYGAEPETTETGKWEFLERAQNVKIVWGTFVAKVQNLLLFSFINTL